ncbi:MAG: response regulator [Deltaproteobacteria bacterium]|nr:response regulator [Deltaproteobacteria bacterium]
MKPILLIVDDEIRVLSALRRTLRKEGYEILLASSPQEALKFIGDYEINAILSDHKMPGMSGLEVLAEAQRQRPNAARILISGWPEAVEPAELAALDVHALLPKPWDDAELKSELARALR